MNWKERFNKINVGDNVRIKKGKNMCNFTRQNEGEISKVTQIHHSKLKYRVESCNYCLYEDEVEKVL